MTEEPKNNQNDYSKEEQQTSDETEIEYRKICEEELEKILEDHKKWLESDGKEGKQADLQKAKLIDSNLKNTELSKADLEKADLSYANLKYASLREANLRKAYLNDTNLKMAKLIEANLYKGNVNFANLKKASLFKANFEKANLSTTNLYKASLVMANLQKSYITSANFQESDMREANLQKAHIVKANLQMINLNKGNLCKARLLEVDLHKSDLSKTNLQNADFSESNLQGANLYKANMQNTILDGVEGLSTSNLKYANLEGATGLLGNEFAQADVTGTKLPEDIKDFKTLETVEKTSQNARKIFFAMLLGCVYSWLTIATTTDVRLLTNTASSPLPIIGTEIPIAWFYIAAPLVLIALYLYFHFYLQGLWESLAGLPAIFPDGKRLDERAYPWILNRLVRRHFKRLKTNRPIMAHLQEYVVIILAWFVVPLTMIGFWLRYIPRHDWVGTIFHIGLIVLSVGFAIIFFHICRNTLRGYEKIPLSWKARKKNGKLYYSVTVILICAMFCVLSYGAIEATRIDHQSFLNIKKLVLKVFKVTGYKPHIEISEEQITSIPDTDIKWIDFGRYKEFEQQIGHMKKVKLSNVNLRLMEAEGSTFLKVDFSKSDLHGANIKNSILRHVYFDGANLSSANINGADIRYSTLSKADLSHVSLREANLALTDFTEANLFEADLKKAFIQEANLSEARLQQANLTGANLRYTLLRKTNLQQASLREVDLTGAKNLTIEQLSKVKTLYKAKLDPELLEQVKKCCPHLLEEPKEETDKTN